MAEIAHDSADGAAAVAGAVENCGGERSIPAAADFADAAAGGAEIIGALRGVFLPETVQFSLQNALNRLDVPNHFFFALSPTKRP